MNKEGMNSEGMQTAHYSPKHSARMVFITVVVLMIALGGYMVLSNPTLKTQIQQTLKLVPTNPEENMQKSDVELFESSIQDRKIPWVEARVDAQPFKVGQSVPVTIYGFSGGKDITGYDLLLGIDPEAFEVESITSVPSAFQIFQFDRGPYHSVTGIKDVQVQNETTFDDTALLTVTVKPKKTGRQIIAILSSKDKESSKFVDRDVQVLTPQIGTVTLEVQ